MIQIDGHGILKSRFFHSRMIFLVLSVSNFCKVGFIISRMLVVLQETNNLVIRCHLCRVTFLGGGIFDKRSAVFVTLYQWVQQMLGVFSHFD